MSMTTTIDIQNLEVTFPGRHKQGPVMALRDVTLSVGSGEVFGFLGPNGAGKTTTIQVLLGFVNPTNGSVNMLGQDVRKSIARQKVGYMPEHPQLYPFLTTRELLHCAGRIFGMRDPVLNDRINTVIEEVNLSAAADRRIGTYSRGMKQRAGLAQTLISDPDLVILDEPTGGLDPLGRMEVRNIIARLRERGKTVFFSSHELSEVELVCDRIAILVNGRIAATGAPDKLRAEHESLEQFFLRTVQDNASDEVAL